MQAPLDFSGRRVLVAGGSKGIGRGIALAFARAGAGVSVCSRGAEALAAVAGELSAFGNHVHTQAADLSRAGEVTSWVESAAGALGGIDVLVNNATGYGFDADQDASWEVDFNVDLMAAVRASRAALPFLEQSTNPSIIHISSIAGLHPRASGPPYGALKAALIHYTGSQALTLAPRHIRVNAIAPGSIDFPGGVWDRDHQEDPQHYQAVMDRIPFGKFGTPEDIAHVALFLASPLAAWVTGQTLCVDGGQGLNG